MIFINSVHYTVYAIINNVFSIRESYQRENIKEKEIAQTLKLI